MPSTARIFLFYGNNSRASLQALRKWQALFLKKYGETTSFLLNVDELSLADFKQTLANNLQTETLFSTPKLLILKRLTKQEKGVSRPFSTAFLALINQHQAALDEQITLVVWEEQLLPASHPLLGQFQTWEKEKKAELRLFQVPSSRELPKAIMAFLRPLHLEIDPAALAWLIEQYNFLERQERLNRRLKTAESLAEDERGWWLNQVLESAALRADKGMLQKSHLLAGLETAIEPVSVFSIVSALENRQWKQARRLLRLFEKNQSEESNYFNLWAALRWGSRKWPDRALANQLSRYLGEMEIIIKNFPLQPAWLMDLLVMRLEKKDKQPLLSSRKLWLAQIQRT